MLKRKATPLEWAFVATALIFTLVMFVLPDGPLQHILRKPPRRELEALRAEGDVIVRSLDGYYANHHSYPPQLPEALDLSRGARYGGWRYKCVAECTGFELVVGHYHDYSFVIIWQPDTKSWYTDS